MKFENNWKSKSLENLEKDFWGEAKEESYTVLRCHKLRKVPLDQLTIKNLRVMIAQGLGLKYLVPLAIEELNKNVLAEGDLFEGDLLEAVRRIRAEFWTDNPDYEEQVNSLIASNAQILEAEGLSNSLIND